jgi:hypothetical protein
LTILANFAVLKRIVVISFSFLILGQSFVRTFWAMDYQLRKEVYLKNCENKYRKDLACDGKCYLKKRVTAAETPQDTKAPALPDAFWQIKEVLLFFEPALSLPALPVTARKSPAFLSTRGLLPNPHPNRVFRPPAALPQEYFRSADLVAWFYPGLRWPVLA